MEWYYWLLIAVGVIGLGWIKLSVYNKIKQNKASKKRYTDED